MNLLRHAKRSTVRDFKILEPSVAEESMAVAEEEDVSDQNISTRIDDDEGDSVSGGEGNAGDDGEEGECNSAAAVTENTVVKRSKKSRVVRDSDEEN